MGAPAKLAVLAKSHQPPPRLPPKARRGIIPAGRQVRGSPTSAVWREATAGGAGGALARIAGVAVEVVARTAGAPPQDGARSLSPGGLMARASSIQTIPIRWEREIATIRKAYSVGDLLNPYTRRMSS
jgi:hypothetical protein